MKFIGGINKANSSSFYNVKLDDFRFSMCWGKLYEECLGIECTRENFADNNLTFAWGYDGLEVDLLSVTMLSVAMGAPYDPKNLRDREEEILTASITHLTRILLGNIVHGNYYLEHKPPQYCNDIVPEIKKLYRDFTVEVLANLPDTWELTTGEILQWIKTKTKGKQNERESTETKGG